MRYSDVLNDFYPIGIDLVLQLFGDLVSGMFAAKKEPKQRQEQQHERCKRKHCEIG